MFCVYIFTNIEKKGPLNFPRDLRFLVISNQNVEIFSLPSHIWQRKSISSSHFIDYQNCYLIFCLLTNWLTYCSLYCAVWSYSIPRSIIWAKGRISNTRVCHMVAHMDMHVYCTSICLHMCVHVYINMCTLGSLKGNESCLCFLTYEYFQETEDDLFLLPPASWLLPPFSFWSVSLPPGSHASSLD